MGWERVQGRFGGMGHWAAAEGGGAGGCDGPMTMDTEGQPSVCLSRHGS